MEFLNYICLTILCSDFKIPIFFFADKTLGLQLEVYMKFDI